LAAWEPEKLIFLRDILEISIMMHRKALLELNFYQKLFKLETKTLKSLFGTLLANKDINRLAKYIIKELRAFLLFMTLQIHNPISMYNPG
jgi:hypothetical protein